ncbi:MAG TPA: adenine deaminase [Thermotogota bacterium]|jgi:adenine deaminase|nr:adenine deaminase [Thermotogota bacterium]
MRIIDIIPVARGEKPADVILKNCKAVNVFSGLIEETNVALFRKRIAGVGDYTWGEKTIDLHGQYLVPGFINAHMHIESTMLEPREFAKAALSRGTTTVIADPHEIANVIGLKGVEFFINYTEGIPMNIYFMLPSCVPATDYETNGSKVRVMDMIGFLEKYPRVLGLGEVMNYPGILNRQEELLTMIELFRHKYKKIDGHAPLLRGKDLNAYISAFIRSDHESTQPEEAMEKLSRGMQVLLRYGTGERDLENLVSIVNPVTQPFLSFCTDDKHPEDIVKGDIDEMIRLVISRGVDPVTAIRIATINTARHYDLRSMGAIAPGYKADMVVVEDLQRFSPKIVFKDSQIVAEDGVCVAKFPDPLVKIDTVMHTIFCPHYQAEDFGFNLKTERTMIRSIEVTGVSVVTHERLTEVTVKEGEPDISEHDIAKIAVINRYTPEKQFSLGFISGTGIKRGALALSVGHDSHNISVTGTSDSDMALAVNHVITCNGGMVVALDGEILACLPLPVAGLMSDQPLKVVIAQNRRLLDAAKKTGCRLANPFMALSFVQLEVIPELKITNLGLMDTNTFRFVDAVFPI